MSQQRLLLEQLEGLYGVFEEFLKPFELACGPACDGCCTCNVSLTTLEGLFILENLGTDDRQRMIGLIAAAPAQRFFRPRLTTNGIAAKCANGEEIADDPNDSARGPCPLLTEGLCSIYELRPFGCRCMVSRKRCTASGQAEMDELILSANTLMMQIIEHIDADGYSGNFTDVILCLASGNFQSLQQITPTLASEYHLIGNRAIPALMIPPRHRAKLNQLLQQVQKVLQP